MAREMEEREMDEIIDKQMEEQMAKDLEMAAREIDKETEELKAREEEDRIREHEREKEDQIRELECTVKQLLAGKTVTVFVLRRLWVYSNNSIKFTACCISMILP